jgi:hypothetical protein
MKRMMSSRERVLAALRHELPDRIPWMEGIVGNGIASIVCGEPIRVDWSVAPDGFPKMSGAQLAEEQKKVNRVFGKDNHSCPKSVFRLRGCLKQNSGSE